VTVTAAATLQEHLQSKQDKVLVLQAPTHSQRRVPFFGVTCRLPGGHSHLSGCQGVLYACGGVAQSTAADEGGRKKTPEHLQGKPSQMPPVHHLFSLHVWGCPRGGDGAVTGTAGRGHSRVAAALLPRAWRVNAAEQCREGARNFQEAPLLQPSGRWW
jgi:hypothetical protein